MRADHTDDTEHIGWHGLYGQAEKVLELQHADQHRDAVGETGDHGHRCETYQHA